MLDLAGAPMLQRIVERVRRSMLVDEVFIATTEHQDDDVIADLCTQLHVGCFRGSESDVLGRVVSALRAFSVDVHVELQGDNLVPEPTLIDSMIGLFLKCEPDFDYVSNGLKTTFPPGAEVAVYAARTLFVAEREAQEGRSREHVGPHIYQRPDRFRVRNVEAPEHLFAPDLHLEVDTPEDYEVVRMLYEHFLPARPAFTLSEAIAFARASGIGALNASVPRRWQSFRGED